MERLAILMVDTPFLFGQYQTRMGFFVNVLATAELAWLRSCGFWTSWTQAALFGLLAGKSCLVCERDFGEEVLLWVSWWTIYAFFYFVDIRKHCALNLLIQLKVVMIGTVVAHSKLERVILKHSLLRILLNYFSRRHHHNLAWACCHINLLRRAALLAWLKLFRGLEEPGILVWVLAACMIAPRRSHFHQPMGLLVRHDRIERLIDWSDMGK